MPFGFFALPLGLLEMVLIAVVIILIFKAISGNKQVGKTIAAVLVAISIMVIVMVVFAGLALFGVQRVTVNELRQEHAVRVAEQARVEAEFAQKRVEAMAEEVRAKADQIRERTEVQVDRIATVPMPADNPGVSTAATPSPTESATASVQPDADPPPTEPAAAPVQPDTAVSQAPPAPAGDVQIAGSPWSNAVEEYQDFEADVYPSLEAAAEALGRRVGQRLMQTTETDDGVTPSIYVWRDEVSGGDAAFITRDVLEAVADGLRQKVDEPAYVSVERPVSGVVVNVAIQDIHFENHSRWRKKVESRSGGLALRVETPEGPFSVSTRFAEAPWVVDRTSFAREYAKGDWLVAYSDGTHTTHEDARKDALTTAAESLLPLARTRINHLSGSDQQQFKQQMAKDPNWLRDRVADELRSRNLVTDQFTQQFDRSYGPVWREAVLVDAAPKRIEQIARSLVQGINVRVAHQKTTWFSFIALAGLIFGTYLFLNMATKGYYAWMLRAALLVGLAVLGLVILNFA
jgi:hypothetical protein